MTLTDTSFETMSRVSLPERLFFGAGGLFCFLPLWDFFIRPGGNPFQLGLLPFWIIAIGGVSIGLPLLVASLAGGTEIIRIDRHSGMVSWSSETPLYRRKRHWRFADITDIRVLENSGSDGPSSHDLMMALKGRAKPIVLRNFARQDDADAACAALVRLIGQAAG